MSCDALRPLLAGYVDGELDAEERSQVEAHLAIGCGGCQDEVDSMREVAGILAEQVSLPTPARWSEFERGLRAGMVLAAPPPSSGLARWRGPLAVAAVAAALLLAVFVSGQLTEPRVALAEPRFDLPAFEHQDPRWAPRAPVPLPPLDEVQGVEAARAGLSPEAIAALASHGLVQVRTQISLGDLYPSRLPPDVPAPLATADASLLLHGAVAGRAALALEREMIIPAMRELLGILASELRLFEATGRTGAVRRAARLARERLGVAAVLYGVDPLLPPDSLERVESDVAAIRDVHAPERSAVLGVTFDYAACVPRGIYVGDEELRAHAQAVRWLSLTGLRMDGRDPGDLDEARAACLMVMALARGRLASGAYGLYGQARLEAAIEVVFGEPDELTVFDVLRSMKQALHNPAPQLSVLADTHAMDQVLRRVRLEGQARGVDRIRSLGSTGPRVHLFGNTRTLEAGVYTSLTSPRLPDRTRPTSLDLLYLISAGSGRRRVTAALSAGQHHGSLGYEAALARLAAETRGWRDPQASLPLRSSLERSRLLALSALLDEEPSAGALPFTGTLEGRVRYTDRLVFAAMAGLNLPSPDPALVTGPLGEEGEAPLVEPLPRFHARLASSAERLAMVLERLGGDGPEVRRAVAELRVVRRLEEALRDASLDVLAGRQHTLDTVRALRGYGSVLRRLGPGDVRSAEDTFELRREGDTTLVLHRVVHRLDRLYMVTVDPMTAKPRLACGAALAVAERWVPGARLTPRAFEGLTISDPVWATHLERARGR